MEDNCQNCNQHIAGNFCTNCGQKKYKRIDRKYLIDELQYSIIHTNKGFFYSVKNLILNPGKTARDFVDGNRVNHYKPILLAFVLSGISAFLSFKIVGFNNMMQEIYAEKMPESFIRNLMAFLSSYSSVVMLLFIPIISLFTVLAFRKWGQNYYEHIVMNAYIQSCYSIFCILLLYPLLYFFNDNSKTFSFIVMLSMFVIPLIMMWFYKGFYPERTLKAIFLRMLLFLVMCFVLYIVLIIIVAMSIAIFSPETLLQFKPKE